MTAGLGDPVSDTELAARFQRDPEMFTVVYDRYARDIFRYVGSRLGVQVADDIAAETFLVAFGQRDRFDASRGSLRPWLFGIATNLVARHRRKEARHYLALARIGPEPPPEGPENRVVSAVTAERLQPQLARALTRLSRGERDVILLVALGELSHEEVFAAAIRSPARRRRLAVRSRGSRRSAGWLAGGLGVAAAATTALVLSIGSTPAVPGGNPPVPGGASAARQEGQRILLAAASSAAAQPSGAYWHFTEKTTVAGTSQTDEEWVSHDMKYWSAQPACGTIPAGVVADGPGYGGFAYKRGGYLLTYQQTEHLPTNPEALAAWFARYTPPGSSTDSWIADAVIALEWLVPTPPLVRAAAFRALAALPIVTGLGPVPGGQGLLITQSRFDGGWEKLVIDPASALVRSDTNAKGTITIEAANWTNQLPRVVPLCQH